MKRRQFLRCTAALSSMAALPQAWAGAAAPEIAFTFDDPGAEGTAGWTWQQLNERILDALAKHRVRSALFVCGKRVDDDAGRQLVPTWDRAGHMIANHSYSHFNFNQNTNTDSDEDKKVTLFEFEADALKNESLIRNFRHFTRLFRYPFLKEGDTIEKRDGMRSFLQEHGYRIGRVTIDASDWAISERLEKRAELNAKGDFIAYQNFFLEHIWERAKFYDSLSQRVVGIPVRHTVLLHHNLLNALYLDDLIAMFVARGWKPIDAEWAYQDPAYDRQPKTLPAGESLIWALAKESGKFEKELRYPAEDDVYENPKMDALKL